MKRSITLIVIAIAVVGITFAWIVSNRREPAQLPNRGPSSVIDTPTLRLATVAWPILHGNERASKSSPLPGPLGSSSASTSGSVAGSLKVLYSPPLNKGVVQLLGRKYYYHQEMQTGLIRAFDPANPRTVIASYDLGPSYPFSAGGIIDQFNRLYYTSDKKLIRLEEDLSSPVFSEPFVVSSSWNGVDFLPDGNLLVTSMGANAVVLGTNPVNGRLPILQEIDLRNIRWKGRRLLGEGNLPNGDLLKGPRPVGENGSFYMTIDRYLVRWSQDARTGRMKGDFDWVFELPGDLSGHSFGSSNAIILSGRICANTTPPEDQTSVLLCIDSSSTKLLFRSKPVPTVLGAPGLHNLGSLEKEGILLMVARNSDLVGGFGAVDARNGKVLWSVALPRVSEAFTISAATRHAYLSYRPEPEGNLHILGIDVLTGKSKVILELPVDEDPSAALWLIGKQKDLFAPVPGGFVRILRAN